MGEPRPAIERLRRRKELHRQRNRFYRVAVAVVGFLVLLFGIVLVLPGVPGPGILLIGLGLAILALEFDRAERLLERILDRVEAAREQTSTWSQVVIGVIGVLTLVGYAVAVLLWE